VRRKVRKERRKNTEGGEREEGSDGKFKKHPTSEGNAGSDFLTFQLDLSKVTTIELPKPWSRKNELFDHQQILTVPKRKKGAEQSGWLTNKERLGDHHPLTVII